MTEQEGKKLLAKYDQGLCDAGEKALIESWYLNVSSSAPQMDGDVDYTYWNNRIKGNLPIKRSRIFKPWPRIAAAASIILIIGAGIFFYANQPKNGTVPTTAYRNDIAPALSGATLTLADGTKVALSNASTGAIAKEKGVNISKSANGQLVYTLEKSTSLSNQPNTLSTAKGQTYELNLPDGSIVFLNAASSITYSATLTERGVRRVKLEGEAFFQISKDKKHPFIIESKGQIVEVLGTQFNISAYPEESTIKTTLVEGSVQIQAANVTKILKPNQQAAFREGYGIQISNVDAEYATAWKNGFFVFDDEDIHTIMNQIGRWYDVEIVFQDDLRDQKFGGSISRYKNVNEILKKLEKTQTIRFKIEGRRITVMK